MKKIKRIRPPRTYQPWNVTFRECPTGVAVDITHIDPIRGKAPTFKMSKTAYLIPWQQIIAWAKEAHYEITTNKSK